MRENKVMRITQVKEGNIYQDSYTCYDEREVYEALSNRVIAKKIHGAHWITRIVDTSLYNGFHKMVITYGNDTRDIFIYRY